MTILTKERPIEKHGTPGLLGKRSSLPGARTSHVSRHTPSMHYGKKLNIPGLPEESIFTCSTENEEDFVNKFKLFRDNANDIYAELVEFMLRKVSETESDSERDKRKSTESAILFSILTLSQYGYYLGKLVKVEHERQMYANFENGKESDGCSEYNGEYDFSENAALF